MTGQRSQSAPSVRANVRQRHHGRWRSGLAVCAACLPVCVALRVALPLSAQEVTGVVRADGAAERARGAGVVLLDSAGVVVHGMLIGEDGQFTLHAPRPGRYRVRARQIGFSPDSSATLALGTSGVTTIELSLKRFVPVLDRVYVLEQSRCVIAPAAGTVALQLWQDVQSALVAAVITESRVRSLDALLTRFSREIDPASGRVVRSTAWQGTGSASEPYRALPADTLAAHGFVVHSGKDIIYYAPDARTLLSDAFARTHCFRPAADAKHPGLVGLAFAPVRGAKGGEVAGALWLDQVSRELRYLEFKYSTTGVVDRADAGDAADATGRIDYERLAWGGWIIAHWVLRLPVVRIEMAHTIATGASLALGAPLTSTRVARLVSLWEIGGDARVATDSSAAVTTVEERSVIQGRIVKGPDSAAPELSLSGMRVELMSASGVAIPVRLTDVNGAFSFEGISAGDYMLRFTSTKLDTLAIAIPDRAIHVGRAARLTTTTVLPTIASAMRSLCGTDPGPGEVALHGVVRDGKTGERMAGATVIAYRYDEVNTGRNFSIHPQDWPTITSADGRYALCTPEQVRPIYVSVTLGARSTVPARLEPSRDRIRMLDLVM